MPCIHVSVLSTPACPSGLLRYKGDTPRAGNDAEISNLSGVPCNNAKQSTNISINSVKTFFKTPKIKTYIGGKPPVTPLCFSFSFSSVKQLTVPARICKT